MTTAEQRILAGEEFQVLATKRGLAVLAERIGGFEQEVTRRLSRLETDVDAIGTGLDEVKAKVDTLEAKVDAMGAKLDEVLAF